MGSLGDAPQVPSRFDGQRIEMLVDENASEPRNRSKRRAQIVRDGITERLQLFHCRFELVGSLLHAFIELAMRGLHVNGHRVEGDAQAPDLIAPSADDPARVITRRDALGGDRQLVKRRRDARAHDPGQQRGQCHAHERHRRHACQKRARRREKNVAREFDPDGPRRSADRRQRADDRTPRAVVLADAPSSEVDGGCGRER